MTTHSFHTRNTDVEDLTRQIIEQHQQMPGWKNSFGNIFPDLRNAA